MRKEEFYIRELNGSSYKNIEMYCHTTQEFEDGLKKILSHKNDNNILIRVNGNRADGYGYFFYDPAENVSITLLTSTYWIIESFKEKANIGGLKLTWEHINNWTSKFLPDVTEEKWIDLQTASQNEFICGCHGTETGFNDEFFKIKDECDIGGYKLETRSIFSRVGYIKFIYHDKIKEEYKSIETRIDQFDFKNFTKIMS